MASDEHEKAAAGYFDRIGTLVSGTVKATAVRIREGLSGLVSLRTLLLAGIILFLLHLFDFIAIPFWPFTTTGTIYVDSPEVYTRERLVNDRYDQDFWLRERLEKLDNPGELQLVVIEQAQSARARAGDVGTEDVEEKANQDRDPAAANNPRGLSFEQEFRVASGIRDMIRQQILENMLDDRHDLTGNSVYGLKFDTTVIPGSNTRRRAFVHVKVKIDDLFRVQDDDEAGKRDNGVPEFGDHLAGWEASQLLAYKEDHPTYYERLKPALNKYKKQDKHYVDWLDDVKRRLNLAEDSVYESMSKSASAEKAEGVFYNEVTGKTLEIVLGIPEEMFWRLNGSSQVAFETEAETEPKAVKLPDPWAKFFVIERLPFEFPVRADGALRKRHRVWFSVREFTEQLIIVDATGSEKISGNSEGASRGEVQPNDSDKPEQIADTDDGESSMEFSSGGGRNSTASEDRPEGGQSAATFGEVPTDLLAVTPGDDAQEDGEDLTTIAIVGDGKWRITVSDAEYAARESGFEKSYEPKYELTDEFVGRIVAVAKQLCEARPERDSYCADPHRTLIDLNTGLFNFVDRMSARDAYSYAIFPKNDVVGVFAETSAQLSAAAPATGFLDLAKRLTETRTASVLTGYGHGGGGKHSIDFGWIVSGRGDMEPAQKSQLALVAVPAWAETLDLGVSVGWLDRQGNPQIDDDASFNLKVAVPPNYEVFDSIFREDVQVTLKPSIRDNEMDKDIYVRAGHETNILIPGSRLWRSAAVTLGAQTARRIRVLPNMEGIIAEFGPVDPPYAAYNVESDPTSGNSGSSNAHTGQAGQESDSVDSGECRKTIRYKEEVDLSVRAVRLRVWTSEGVALAKKKVCVVYDSDEVLSKASNNAVPDGLGGRGQRGTK